VSYSQQSSYSRTDKNAGTGRGRRFRENGLSELKLRNRNHHMLTGAFNRRKGQHMVNVTGTPQGTSGLCTEGGTRPPKSDTVRVSKLIWSRSGMLSGAKAWDRKPLPVSAPMRAGPAPG